MESYTGFANVYDELMDETPYEEWKERIEKYVDLYGISEKKKVTDNLTEEALLESERNLILDLGCGTGTLTEMLAEDGYDMIGIDSSMDMLNIAMKKRDSSGSQTLYLLQDMRELELYSTVGTVISVCDSLNYLLEEEDVKKTFSLVWNYLYPGGIFIFDFNTVYKYETIIGDTTIAENREDCSFIWENYYDSESGINEYDLTLFVKQGDLYEKIEETHFQRGYTLEQMERWLRMAGFDVLLVQDSDTEGEATDISERICIVAQCKKGSEQLK